MAIDDPSESDPVRRGLEAAVSLAEVVLPDQAAFHQEVNGAVDGGGADLEAALLEIAVNPLDRGMVGHAAEGLGDLEALARHRQAAFPEIPGEPLDQAGRVSRRTRHRSTPAPGAGTRQGVSTST